MSPWPDTMITLARGSNARRSESAARPSSGSFGRGGSPRSSKVTVGRSAVNADKALDPVPSHGHLVVLRQRPLHLGADVLVVVHDEQPGFAHCPSLAGKAHLKRRALAGFAFHLHATAMRLNDRAGLKQADAKPLRFGALKRTEQRLLQERRAHAAAIVRYGQHDAVPLMLRPHLNPAAPSRGVTRVQHQVGHDALDLFAIGQDPWQRLRAPWSVRRSASAPSPSSASLTS